MDVQETAWYRQCILIYKHTFQLKHLKLRRSLFWQHGFTISLRWGLPKKTPHPRQCSKYYTISNDISMWNLVRIHCIYYIPNFRPLNTVVSSMADKLFKNFLFANFAICTFISGLAPLPSSSRQQYERCIKELSAIDRLHTTHSCCNVSYNPYHTSNHQIIWIGELQWHQSLTSSKFTIMSFILQTTED